MSSKLHWSFFIKEGILPPTPENEVNLISIVTEEQDLGVVIEVFIPC